MTQHIQDFLENLKVHMKSINNAKMTRSVVNNKITQYKKLDYLVDYRIEYSSVNNTHDFNLQQANYETVVDEFIKDLFTYSTHNIDINLNASTDNNFRFYASNDIGRTILTELFNSDMHVDTKLRLHRVFSHVMPLNIILQASERHLELFPNIIDTHLKNPFKSYDVKIFPIFQKILEKTKNTHAVYAQMQERIFSIIEKYQEQIRDEFSEQLDFFEAFKKHLPIQQWNKLVTYTPLLTAINDNEHEQDIFLEDEVYVLQLLMSISAIKNHHPTIMLVNESNKIIESICDYLNNDEENVLNICEATYTRGSSYGGLFLKSSQPLDKQYIIKIFNDVVSELVEYVHSNHYRLNIDESIVKTCINKAVLNHMLPSNNSHVKQQKI